MNVYKTGGTPNGDTYGDAKGYGREKQT